MTSMQKKKHALEKSICQMLNGIMCCDKSGKVRLEMCIKKVNSMVLMSC